MRKDPRYPIGRLEVGKRLSTAARAEAIAAIAALPSRLFDAVRGLDETRLDTPYRAGGWTVRQVVHHLADSHVNAYVRHKLTISEQMATLPAYDENVWARMPDAQVPIGTSLAILQGIHERWVACLRAQPERTFARRAMHTEDGEKTLDELVGTYAWHGAHHVAHITSLRAAKGF